MQTYKVVQVIQSENFGDVSPCRVLYYSGRSLAQALSAFSTAAVSCEEPDKYYTVLSVTMEVIQDA